MNSGRWRHRAVGAVAVASVVGLWLGAPAAAWWQNRPLPAPLRYPQPGKVGFTVDPNEDGRAAVEQGGDLVLHWRICNDAPEPLSVTAARNFRSNAGHVVPLVAGQRTFAPGCNDLVNRQVGLTDDLLPGYRWYLEGVSTVTYGGRTWQVPYRTDEFVVTPREARP